MRVGEDQDPDGPPVVAAFDFDGTLARPRSTFGFARRLAPPVRLAIAALAAGAGALPRPSSVRFKEELFARLLRGRAVAEVDGVARRHAEEILRSGLRREMVERAAGHRRAGHRLVVVTAGFEAYVRPVAERLAFEDVIGTGIAVHDGVCTGGLDRPDLRGPAKARLLRAWVEEHAPGARVHAYGDSAADRGMLRYARRTRGQRPVSPTG